MSVPQTVSEPPPRTSTHTLAAVTPSPLVGTVRSVHLTSLRGPSEGERWSSTGTVMTLGAHPSADVQLEDPSVSRFHCEIRVEGEAVLLKDLGSRNGSFVDGVQVTEAPLHAGSVLTLGQTWIRIDYGDDRVPLRVSERERFGCMVGRSPALRHAFSILERAAQSDAAVLIGGETGVGKGAAAESLHAESTRAKGPFVVVDCGAIPADLLESELFGHERGSFTGATARKEGAFHAANGGTIFLDEIGELPLSLQPKLLRALDGKKIKRVGSNSYEPVDVRIVAATNRDLRKEVNDRRFRSDLYYRLAVIELELPPLRQCLDDLPLLVEALASTLGVSGEELLRSPGFLSRIKHHRWPGNVRELRNYIARCSALREVVDVERPSDSEAAPRELQVDTAIPYKEHRTQVLRHFERAYVEAILAEHGGNVTEAARAAGVDRAYLYRLLWRHGLR